MDDDWEDTLHAGKSMTLLLTMDTALLMSRIPSEARKSPKLTRKIPLVRLSPLQIPPSSFEVFGLSPSVPTVCHPPSLNESSLILLDEKLE